MNIKKYFDLKNEVYGAVDDYLFIGIAYPGYFYEKDGKLKYQKVEWGQKYAKTYDEFVEKTNGVDFEKVNIYASSGYFNSPEKFKDFLTQIHTILLDFDVVKKENHIDMTVEEIKESCLKKWTTTISPLIRELGITYQTSFFSGHGIQVLIAIDPKESKQIVKIRSIAERLIEGINAKVGYEFADKNTKDAGTRYFRLPYSINNKDRNKPIPTEIIEQTEGYTSLESLEKICALLPMPQAKVDKSKIDKENKKTAKPNSLPSIEYIGKFIPTPSVTPAINNQQAHYITNEVKEPESVVVNKDDNSIVGIVKPYYIDGKRDYIIFNLSGLFALSKVPPEEALSIIGELAKDDEELDSRLDVVKTTYEKYRHNQKVGGYYELKTILSDEDLNKLCDLLDFKVSNDTIPIENIIDMIMEQYDVVFDASTDKYWFYEALSGIWKSYNEIKKTPIAEFVQRIVGMNHFTPNFVSKLNLNLMTKVLKELHFDSKDNIITFTNGTMEWNKEGFVFREHRKEDYTTIQIPHAFDMSVYNQLKNNDDFLAVASPYKAFQFLRSIVKEDDFSNLMKLIGLSMTKKNMTKIIFLYGAGSNGKSQFINLLTKVVGENNYFSASLSQIEQNRFSIVHLDKKLINVCSDIDEHKIMNSANIKALVSGDSITVEQKYENSYKTRIFAKLIFSGNEIPESHDKSFGWLRRQLIIKFPFEFTSDESKIDNKTIFRRDDSILKFTEDEKEMEFVIAYGVYYYEKYLQEGFVESSMSLFLKDVTFTENSSILSFIDEKIEFTSNYTGEMLSPYELHDIYKTNYSDTFVSFSEFNKELKKKLPEKFPELDVSKFYGKCGTRGSDLHNKHVYKGLRIKE